MMNAMHKALLLSMFAVIGATRAAEPQPAKGDPAPGTLVTITQKDPRIATEGGVDKGTWCGAMWCPFAGTSVKLIGSTGPSGGTADIYLDGIYQRTADWYSDKDVHDVTLFAAENLPDGKHLLGILTRGGKRAESQGTSINWSRIEFIAGAHPERFVPVRRTRFDPNVPVWLDDRGEPIQWHMGGIMVHEGKYYMIGGDWLGRKGFGAEKKGPFKNQGLSVYSSADLMNWTYHGNSVKPASDRDHPLHDPERRPARPKLLHARGTGKFVALFQLLRGVEFKESVTGLAVADKPEGPYEWHGILEYEGKPVQGADTAVFTDDDGAQYLITGKDWGEWSDHRGFNVTDCLYQLTPDCLHVEKARVLGAPGEAPAIFKHDGVYYLLQSHLTGLGANDNFYHTATNIWGPWKRVSGVDKGKGLIAQGEHSSKTFMTQTMDVVPVAGKKDAFIWIGDSIGLGPISYTTRTVWLPVSLKGKGEMEIRWRDCWDLSVFDGPR